MVKSKKIKFILTMIPLIIITFIYFSFPLFIFPDTSSYYYNLEVLQGVYPISTWQSFRGPSLSLLFFPFTFILGDSMFSLLIPTYLIFIGSLAIIYKVICDALEKFKASKVTRTLVYIVFLTLIVFNPLLFGYFHSLLTEFVAIFLGLLTCFLSWKWLEISFQQNKFKYVLYNLAFILLIIFSWFLKQPYLSISLFPLLIATVISVVRETSLKNILQRTMTVISCIVLLFVSISCWDNFLSTNGVDRESSDFNQIFLSSSIVSGISNLRVEEQEFYLQDENISGDKFLLDSDKSKIESILENKSPENFRVYNVLGYSGKIKDKMVLYYEGPYFSTKEAIIFWLRVFKKHPEVTLDSYVSNYLGAINIYKTYNSPYSIYPIKEYNESSRENIGIGLTFFNNDDNLLWMTADQVEQMGRYDFSNDSDILSLRKEEIISDFYLNTFKVAFSLLPFLFLYSLYRYIKISKSKDDRERKYYSLILILSGLSILHALFHVVTGAILDRYFFVVFPEVIFSLILLLIVTFNNSATRKKKTARKIDNI